MWWPLFSIDGGEPALTTGRFRFEPVMEDIESLNCASERGELEITAISCAQYPRVQDRYVITSCGASLGDGYGPRVVAATPLTVESLRDGQVEIAVPGERTSAFAALSLLLGPGAFRYRVLHFQEILGAVARGDVPAGLVIHEGQLTHEQEGLHLVVDLGQWWTDEHDLPLPLGLNTIRRDLEERHGPGTLAEVTATLLESVRFALENRDRSLAYARRFARGTPPSLADRFVALYVNRWTLDFGPPGRRAVEAFLGAMRRAELIPADARVEFVSPAVPA
jgi:1,4-dihydroxy-6-naphthoate synthase